MSAKNDRFDADATANWEEQYAAVRASFELSSNRQLGYSNEFKRLQTLLSAHELKACTSLACEHPVRCKTFFNKDCNKKDGLNSFCKNCCNGAGKRAAVAAGVKRKAAALSIQGTQEPGFDRCDVENRAMKWVQTWLHEHFNRRGIEVEILPEFRRADFAIRFKEWPPDTYLPVQLKSDSERHVDGKLKANNSQNYRFGGGSVQFQNCTGYNDMMMFFVKTRMDDAGNMMHTFWWCTGDKVQKQKVSEGSSNGMHQNNGYKETTGSLLISKTAAISPEELKTFPSLLFDAFCSNVHLRCTWEELWLNVRGVSQRKEVAGMLALSQVGDLQIQPGNQTSIDCIFCSKATQVKTPYWKTGRALLAHEVHGLRQPYNEEDGIEQVVEPFILCSDGVFYLLYALQPVDVLLKHGLFASKTHPGQTTITIPWGQYTEWITGDKPREKREQTAWIAETTYSWRKPVRLTPDKWLSADLLHEVAHTAARPDLCPVT